MKLFPYAHAAHAQWQVAADAVLGQLRACMRHADYAAEPSLGLLYVTDHLARDAQALLTYLARELPMVNAWSGTIGVGISSNGVEYFDEPAIVVMLCDLDEQDYRVFSGTAPLGQALAQGFVAQTALVHADGHAPYLSELIEELADSTRSGFVFGGLTSSRAQALQFARHAGQANEANTNDHGVYQGGLSGVAFSQRLQMITRVTQGCTPLGQVREVTKVNDHLVMTLDNAPALYALMQDLHVPIDNPRSAVDKVRETLVGLSEPGQPVLRLTGGLDDAVMVRHIIGLDPVNHGVAVAHHVKVGMQATFCKRDAVSAKADLLRIATEIREEVEPQELLLEPAVAQSESLSNQHASARRMVGAIYVSCTGRGGPHFGAPHAELQIIRRALGDVPLVGFFAAGEIANRQVYGYTGVLTVFTSE